MSGWWWSSASPHWGCATGRVLGAVGRTDDHRPGVDSTNRGEKLRYIHANPVSKRWRLAEDAVEYPHSSFAFYVRGENRSAPLTPYQEFGYLGGKGAPW